MPHNSRSTHTPTPAVAGSRRRRFARRVLGRTLQLLSGVVLFGGFALLIAGGWTRPGMMLVMLLVFPFHYGARKLLAPTAEELLAKDRRPPVLYLRSFQADTDELGWALGRAMLGRGVDHASEEEALASVLGHIGPVVAIGRPGETLPKLGAARTYVGDDEWQERVSELASRASLVVLRVGETQGFWWEVRRAVEFIDPRKVLFYVPGEIRSDREKAYQTFRERAAAILPKGLPPALGRARYIWFDDEWTPALLGERKLGFFRWLRLQASLDGAAQRVRAPVLEPLFQAHGLRTPGMRGSVLGWFGVAMIAWVPVFLALFAVLAVLQAIIGW